MGEAVCGLLYDKLEVSFSKNRLLGKTSQKFVNSYFFKLVKPRIIESFTHNFIKHVNQEVANRWLKVPDLLKLMDGTLDWVSARLIPETLYLPDITLPIPLTDGTLQNLKFRRSGEVKCSLAKNGIHIKFYTSSVPSFGSYKAKNMDNLTIHFTFRYLLIEFYIVQPLKMSETPTIEIKGTKWDHFTLNVESDDKDVLMSQIQSSVISAVNSKVINNIYNLLKGTGLKPIIIEYVTI